MRTVRYETGFNGYRSFPVPLEESSLHVKPRLGIRRSVH